jgi:hypothetical protein
MTYSPGAKRAVAVDLLVHRGLVARGVAVQEEVLRGRQLGRVVGVDRRGRGGRGLVTGRRVIWTRLIILCMEEQ